MTTQDYINYCNIQPIWGRVAVKPLDVKDTDRQFKGSAIYIPETVMDKEQRAQQHAILVAVDTDSFGSWKGTKPEIGQKVLIDKYVGFHFPCPGPNGVDIEYRMLNDDQIVGIVKE